MILPKYGTISEEFKQEMKKIKEFTVSVGWRNQYCGIEELTYQGITYYFVDNEYYFKRMVCMDIVMTGKICLFY